MVITAYLPAGGQVPFSFVYLFSIIRRPPSWDFIWPLLALDELTRKPVDVHLTQVRRTITNLFPGHRLCAVRFLATIFPRRLPRKRTLSHQCCISVTRLDRSGLNRYDVSILVSSHEMDSDRLCGRVKIFLLGRAPSGMKVCIFIV